MSVATPKRKVIFLATHKGQTQNVQPLNQNSKQIHVPDTQIGKTCAVYLVLVFRLMAQTF